MDGRGAAMDRYQAMYGGNGPLGIPRSKITDFLGGIAQQGDPRGGFLGGLQSGLSGAMGAGARRMQTQDEMERQALMQDLEERRVRATEQSAGADVTRANADMWKVQHPPEPSWNDLSPMDRGDRMLPWLEENYPGVPKQQLIPMVPGIDAPDTPDPSSDPTVAENVAQAYSRKFGVDLDTARVQLRLRRPQRFTEKRTVPVKDKSGRVLGITEQTVSRYSYGDADLDAAMNMGAPAWASGGGSGAAAAGSDGIGLDPNLMSPEDRADYDAMMTVMDNFRRKYGGAGR